MKKLSCFITAIILITTAIPCFVSAERIVDGFLMPIGEPDPNAVKIYTDTDLRKMADSDDSFVLMNDIDLSGYDSWNPISNFSGTFDGQGYAIKNMTSKVSQNTNKYHAGLFMTTGYNVVIKNLKMLNASIDLSYIYTSAGTSIYGGAIVSDAYSGATISNCAVECITPEIVAEWHYSNSVSYSYVYLGGIVGRAYGIIENCTTTTFLDVTSLSRFYNESTVYVGGIIGYGGTVSDSIADGLVAGIADSQQNPSYRNLANPIANAYVGGLIGYATMKDFVNCQNNALVYAGSRAIGNSGQSKLASSYAGGIAGCVRNSTVTFTDCINRGNIGSQTESWEYYGYTLAGAGGIVGQIGPNNYSPLSITFNNCKSENDLIVSQGNGYHRNGSFAGTLMGSAYNNQTSSFGNITLTISECETSGRVETRSNSEYLSLGDCGGFVGRIRSEFSNFNLNVEKSRHTGQIVPVPETLANDKQFFAGGIIGRVLAATGNLTFEPYCFYSQSELDAIGIRTTDTSTNVNNNITITGLENINPETVAISFNSNGGSPVSSIEAVAGDKINALPIPVRDGFVFDGWYLEEGLINEVIVPYEIIGNVTFYAKWESNETLIHVITAQNILTQGAKVSNIDVYRVKTGMGTEYKLILKFTGLAQNMRLYAASYDTNGQLTNLLASDSGGGIVDRLELNNIPSDVFEGNFKITLWDKDMHPVIVPITRL